MCTHPRSPFGNLLSHEVQPAGKVGDRSSRLPPWRPEMVRKLHGVSGDERQPTLDAEHTQKETLRAPKTLGNKTGGFF